MLSVGAVRLQRTMQLRGESRYCSADVAAFASSVATPCDPAPRLSVWPSFVLPRSGGDSIVFGLSSGECDSHE